MGNFGKDENDKKQGQEKGGEGGEEEGEEEEEEKASSSGKPGQKGRADLAETQLDKQRVDIFLQMHKRPPRLPTYVLPKATVACHSTTYTPTSHLCGRITAHPVA